MNATERRNLVERPFPRIHYIFPVKRWAGVQVQDMDSFFRRAYGAVSKYEGAEEAALKGHEQNMRSGTAIECDVTTRTGTLPRRITNPNNLSRSAMRQKTREFNDAV